MRKTLYKEFLPTPQRKRKAFLDKVRQKVNYFKPKIEERCNIKLGQIQVKDNKDWLADVLYSRAQENAINNAWTQGRIPTELDYLASFTIASTVEVLATVPIWLYNTLAGADFRHHNNTIYVPFYFMNKFMDIDFKERSKHLDYGVVHELSHSLWDKISGNSVDPSRLWFEGFATYCTECFFTDLFPPGIENTSDGLPSVYIEGKRKIETLVERYGKEIVLEIPKIWKEF
ncbi:hypothetical protein J4471_02340 [Candidatus Woesearchaeota archaeon]|nr:hypothetical protein [Candidatus Woesearchaeota archaeon]